LRASDPLAQADASLVHPAPRLHPVLVCVSCRSGELLVREGSIVCGGCARAFPLRDGVPVFAEGGTGHGYVDSDDLWRLLETFGRYYNATTFAEAAIRRGGYRRVLSVGEGHGEYMLALARKLPDVEFVGFDLEPDRVARAERLRRLLEVPNAYFYVADANRMPFRAGAFDFIYERGVFHILPDKERHLAELGRLAPGGLLLMELANGWRYLANWEVCRLLFRAILGTRIDLSPHRATVEHLKRIGGYRTWRGYRAWFAAHGMAATPIWHNFFVKVSYHRRFPALIGRASSAFGLEVECRGRWTSKPGAIPGD
jgi:ubiquinone/menaquinone biosynthesis C-methylase UbiE/uncharacterized protein YbaR (Trm112 family)